MEIVCNNIDRIATLELRGEGLPRGVIVPLYEAARAGGMPLSLACARELDQVCRRGGNVAVVTGLFDPKHFPNGESDGPLGAVVLGKSLELHGAKVTYLVEREVTGVMEGLAAVIGAGCRCRALSREDESLNTALAAEFDAAVFIEKTGATKEGVYHLVTGTDRPGCDSSLVGFLNEMNESGKLTIGLGDGGNEIGFGKIFEAARRIVPFGAECLCPRKEGIVTAMATKILFPACTSNIAAYAICAALSLVTGNPDLLHTPEAEISLIKATVPLNSIDGGSGMAREYVDGIPASVNAAIVEAMRGTVEVFRAKRLRTF
ncbi:MAG: glutamate cyclase domain-containing protein [Ignavibacteriales bacterium]